MTDDSAPPARPAVPAPPKPRRPPTKHKQSIGKLGALDALTIRSNTARAVYGYEVQESNDLAQSQLLESEAKQAREAGDLSALGTFLSGASSVGAKYAPLQSGNSPAFNPRHQRRRDLLMANIVSKSEEPLMPFPNAPLVGATGGGNPSTTVAQAQALLGLSYISVSLPVNFNAVGDTPIDIPLPQGFSTYAVDNVFIANASAPLNGAKFGLFTQAGGAGAAIVAGGNGRYGQQCCAGHREQHAADRARPRPFGVLQRSAALFQGDDRATWPGPGYGDRSAFALCTVLGTCSHARGRLN